MIAQRPLCPCKVESSACIHISGSGNPNDLYRATWKLSADPGQRLVRSPSGLRLLLPTEITHRPAVKSIAFFEQPIPDLFPMPVKFEFARYDSGGMWDPDEPEVFTIGRAGWYSVGTFMTLDADDDFHAQASIQVNDIHNIVQEGPFLFSASASPPLSIALNRLWPFSSGDRLKVFVEPVPDFVEGIVIRKDRYFYASYRGT